MINMLFELTDEGTKPYYRYDNQQSDRHTDITQSIARVAALLKYLLERPDNQHALILLVLSIHQRQLGLY